MSSEYLGFLEDDLQTILASEVFDQPMEYLPEGGDPVTFRGIFSAPTAEQNPGGSNAPVTAQGYSVTFKETDLPRRPERNDLISARGHTWRVMKIHSDGQGLLVAYVQKAQP